MERLCINDCKIDGLIFIYGGIYNVEYNPIIKKMIIHNPYGYTAISKSFLDKNFL